MSSGFFHGEKDGFNKNAGSQSLPWYGKQSVQGWRCARGRNHQGVAGSRAPADCKRQCCADRRTERNETCRSVRKKGTWRDGWVDRTVVIVASGPSLTEHDCNEVARRQSADGWKVIAVKDNFRRLPTADVVYACDPTFWDAYLDEVKAHGAELWTQDAGAAQRHMLHWVKGLGLAGLGRDCIHWGGNSGYQAVNLAYLWGAKRIILLGFDMQCTENKSHWFGDHPKGKGFDNPKVFNSWINHFNTLARDLSDQGIDVFNVTRQTALECFVKTTLARIP